MLLFVLHSHVARMWRIKMSTDIMCSWPRSGKNTSALKLKLYNCITKIRFQIWNQMFRNINFEFKPQYELKRYSNSKADLWVSSDLINNTSLDIYSILSPKLSSTHPLRSTHLFVTFNADLFDVPLLVPRSVINGLVFRLIESHVQFVTVKCPWYEDDVAFLFVEWKMLNIQCAVSLDHSWKHPQDLSVGCHDRKGVHKILETVICTETNPTHTIAALNRKTADTGCKPT